jgi:hypothetical protein
MTQHATQLLFSTINRLHWLGSLGLQRQVGGVYLKEADLGADMERPRERPGP